MSTRKSSLLNISVIYINKRVGLSNILYGDNGRSVRGTGGDKKRTRHHLLKYIQTEWNQTITSLNLRDVEGYKMGSL